MILNECPENDPCTSGETCCVTNAGDLGCCPYENAVCCGNYCCPQGMKCDLKEMRCQFKTVISSMKKSFVLFNTPFVFQHVNEVLSYPISVIDVEIENKCSNPDYSCKEGMTCCKLFDGEYGCCPYKNAQCCADGKHCCPQGFKCDLQDGRCLPKKKAEIKLKDNICPDPKVTCPQGTTCCALSTGSFGCCPYADGVCCRDGAHCCPHGTQCDLKHGRCQLPAPGGLSFFSTQTPHQDKMEKVSV